MKHNIAFRKNGNKVVGATSSVVAYSRPAAEAILNEIVAELNATPTLRFIGQPPIVATNWKASLFTDRLSNGTVLWFVRVEGDLV